MADYSIAREIFSRFPGARLAPQSADSWKGAFPLPQPVADYYLQLGPDDLEIKQYGQPYNFPSLARLWDHQRGFRFHHEPDEVLPGWNDDWLVIADRGGDPFIYSRATGKILFAFQGMGSWEPVELFNGLEPMANILAVLNELAAAHGEALYDENFIVQPEFQVLATQKLNALLDSFRDTNRILMQLGWIVEKFA